MEELPERVKVIQCKSCRSIVGDTVSLRNVNRELRLLCLTAATDVEVDVHTQAKTSLTGPDAYSFYYHITCKCCKQVLGRRYVSVPEPLRAELSEAFCLQLDCVTTYAVGEAELVFTGADQAYAVASTARPLSRLEVLESDMLKVKHMCLHNHKLGQSQVAVLDGRLCAAEARLALPLPAPQPHQPAPLLALMPPAPSAQRNDGSRTAVQEEREHAPAAASPFAHGGARGRGSGRGRGRAAAGAEHALPPQPPAAVAEEDADVTAASEDERQEPHSALREVDQRAPAAGRGAAARLARGGRGGRGGAGKGGRAAAATAAAPAVPASSSAAGRAHGDLADEGDEGPEARRARKAAASLAAAAHHQAPAAAPPAPSGRRAAAGRAMAGFKRLASEQGLDAAGEQAAAKRGRGAGRGRAKPGRAAAGVSPAPASDEATPALPTAFTAVTPPPPPLPPPIKPLPNEALRLTPGASRGVPLARR